MCHVLVLVLATNILRASMLYNRCMVYVRVEFLLMIVHLLWCVGPPGEPAGVKAVNVEATSVNLTWWPSYDNGRSVQYYIVELFNLNEGYWKRPNASCLYMFDLVTNWIAESQITSSALRLYDCICSSQDAERHTQSKTQTERTTRACATWFL